MSDEVALEAVEVLGLYDALKVEAIFAVLLQLDAAALPHGGGEAQLVVGQQDADGVDAVAEGLVQLLQQLVESVAGLGTGEQDVRVKAQCTGLVALVVDGQAGDVGAVEAVQHLVGDGQLLLPLLVAVWVAAGQLARRRLSRFGRLETIRPLMPDASTGRRRLKFILYLTAFALLTLALARPQLGSKLREVESRGIEMMLVVDVSNSMLAEDFQPNRLERTKYAIDKLFDGLKQDRVGLVVFAGDAVVQLPITSDYRMAKAFARRISPSMVSVQGTDIGQALSLATMSFSEKGDNPAGRVIVLITDGEGHDSGAIEAAERAAEQGIRIFTIGIGTPEGAPIQIGGEFIKDDKGEMVVSKLGEPLLEKIAQATDGAYIRSTNQSIGLDEIVRTINNMEKGDLAALRFEEFNEQFQYLIGAALVLLLLEFLLLDRRNPLLRRFNIFGTDTEK